MHESFDDQDTEFTYEIPDCLMDGDYIELHGVCHGERIVFELLTKEGSTQNLVDELPLQIILTTNGPVTVISRNRKEVAKQERFVKNGIQDNQSFELCVHACEDRYIVILNKEKVCEQRHLVPLRDAFALSMQGKVDILSLEFKDIYYDEEEMNNTANMSSANNNTGSFRADDMHTGFVRVNELRQSSIRRSEPPIMVPTRTGSKMEKQSIKNKTTPATSSGSLNRSEPGFAKQVSVPGINLGVSNRLSKEISKKPAPEIAAYLQKTNPAIEYEAVNLTGLKHLSDDVHFTPFDRKYSDEYENISGHHDQYKQKTLSNPRQSVNISPTSDLHSQGKFKGPAPEVASIIHSKHPASNLGDITITQGPDSHFRPFTPDQSPKTLRRTSELSTDLANLKLKGTAPEMAAVIHSRSKSPNREDITLTQGSDLHFNLNSTVDVEGSKHFKKSGSASEIAADIHKNNLAGRFPYDDYTLTGFSESPTQRIKYDVKGNLKTSRKAISLSERISGDEDTESGGSEVFTDNECYLEVGRSQYYFERKRSLKNYRSKRSKKLEREARRNMGLSRNDSEESPSSSISSLKPTDRKLTPKYRKRSGNRKEEVSSWLKSANSSNSPVRIESNVRSSYTSNVYAAAPLIQQPSIQKYMLKDINELIKGDATMDLPQPLTPGRSVLICGHFKCNKIINQSCLIQLQFITSCNQVSKCKILYLRIWSDGSLDVLNNLGTDAMISVSSPKNSQLSTINDNELCINDSQKIYFTIKFISQSFYTAITSNDLFTLLLKNQFPKSVSYQLTSFKLENSENAKLDKFIMPRNLCLPLIIRLQDASKVDNTLSLLTKLTADTKRVTIEYIYLPINSISVQIILDFVTNYLIIKKTSKYENDCIECAENELTYIPEQIREIKLHWYNNSLKVLLNTEESIIHNFGQHPSLHYLSHVQINGDFMLLNVELQSEEHNLPPKGYS
ncbi:Galectin carbohydrate recognition domain isoform 1 [Schistosoma japonicum]|uniref:Galectin carbohydrate recognition domain isoform 1 n=1 Tax=Schistosoma japonicum TaxID=6182 RepID=A0A4Z2DLJ8_SCHJA|nr:Galectin carbohydrate recognition domain isoform 1 [Schistosoma japonicum]